VEKQSREVIILGAGLAGLTLAYQLKKQGINALILESRNRIGGRIHTIEQDGATLELGATWFADKHVNLLSLLDELGIDKFDQAYGKIGVYELAHGEKQLFELPQQPEATYRVKGGTSAIIESLASKLDKDQIALNQKVELVSFDGDAFQISTNNNSFKSSFLVSTLPPNLTVSQIQFKPALPDYLIELAQKTHTWMGESIKVGFFSPTPFWMEKGIGTVYSQRGPITELYDHSNENGFALKGFIHDGFVTLPKDERERAVRQQLSNLFGEENIAKGTYTDTAWKEEKDTYANYPQFVVPHQNNGNSQLRKGIFNDRMLLAGSETAPSFPGYMDGAVEAAISTSKKIIDLLSTEKVLL